MIKFFRTIRKRLLSEGKTSKYFKYAIGEIVLVVIGILIALQINNWNEARKQHQSMKVALKSLVEDLKKDTLQLNDDIQIIKKDLHMLEGFRIRLSQPEATIDTLKHIARFEYLPFFNPSNELNRNTIVSLLSTGKIDYFDDAIKSKILTHNAEQLKLLKVMDENMSIFLNSQYNQGLLLQSEHPDKMMSSATIKGPLLDQYWKQRDDHQLLDVMLSKISGKTIMNTILMMAKVKLLNTTRETLHYLNTFDHKDD